MSMTYQLIYVSSSREHQNREALTSILSTSRENNERDGLTGLLVYHDQVFFQVLEGSKEDVQNCYVRIIRDARHHGMSLIMHGDVSHRAFPSWTMGFARPEEFDDDLRSNVLSLIELQERGRYGLGTDPAVKALATSVLNGFRG